MYKKDSESYFTRSAIKEISLIRKHFNIKGKGEKTRIDGNFSPDNISSFFTEYFAAVRPKNLGNNKILPKPVTTKLRALYVGHPDINILTNLIVRHILYVDQIVIIDPFATLPHQEILKRPAVWAQVIANMAICLAALEEWIIQGLILIIPSVQYHYPELDNYIFKHKAELSKSIPREDPNTFETYLLTRLLVNEPKENRDEALTVIEKMGKEFRPGERENILNEVNKYEEKYPVRFRLSTDYFDKYFKGRETISQVFQFSLGMPLFLAPAISDYIGAYLIFERKQFFETLMKSKIHGRNENRFIQELSIAFQNLDFPFLHNVPLNKALKLRNDGYLHNFRVYLKEIWNKISFEDNENLDKSILDFSDRLKSEYDTLQRDWQSIYKELRIKAVTSGLTIGLSAASLVAMGNINWGLGSIIGSGVGLLKEQVTGYLGSYERSNQLGQNPLSVFIELEK